MEDINNYLTSIQQEVVAEEKTVKLARLIILLIKIEKELNKVKSNLLRLKKHQEKHEKNARLEDQINHKIDSVENLLAKIRKARLNLNFYFI
ncbi:MAG: chromosome segregation protein SMC [Xenococcaceae cyanobacterium MO_188.B19]|nr:chromosome segregation protein SMC [Xenococcaceae cyanobacterium MO_188.B19]